MTGLRRSHVATRLHLASHKPCRDQPLSHQALSAEFKAVLRPYFVASAGTGLRHTNRRDSRVAIAASSELSAVPRSVSISPAHLCRVDHFQPSSKRCREQQSLSRQQPGRNQPRARSRAHDHDQPSSCQPITSFLLRPASVSFAHYRPGKATGLTSLHLPNHFQPSSKRCTSYFIPTELADIPRPVSFDPATFSQSCVASATSSRNRGHAATSLRGTRYFVVSMDLAAVPLRPASFVPATSS